MLYVEQSHVIGTLILSMFISKQQQKEVIFMLIVLSLLNLINKQQKIKKNEKKSQEKSNKNGNIKPFKAQKRKTSEIEEPSKQSYEIKNKFTEKLKKKFYENKT